MQFQKLNKLLKTVYIKENMQYRLNEKGEKAVKQYLQLINDIEEKLVPLLRPYIKLNNVEECKQFAINIIANVNKHSKGNEIFQIMSRLDALTSGGKNYIDGNKITFNPGDSLLGYLEKVAK